jgi:hypothetical protein
MVHGLFIQLSDVTLSLWRHAYDVTNLFFFLSPLLFLWFMECRHSRREGVNDVSDYVLEIVLFYVLISLLLLTVFNNKKILENLF